MDYKICLLIFFEKQIIHVDYLTSLDYSTALSILELLEKHKYYENKEKFSIIYFDEYCRDYDDPLGPYIAKFMKNIINDTVSTTSNDNLEQLMNLCGLELIGRNLVKDSCRGICITCDNCQECPLYNYYHCKLCDDVGDEKTYGYDLCPNCYHDKKAEHEHKDDDFELKYDKTR